MALTDEQKTEVRYYLGYSETSVHASSALESGMNALSTFAETKIGTILERLATIEATLDGGTSKLGLKRVEDIEWHAPGAQIEAQRGEGRRQCQSLATLLGVPLRTTPFDDAPRSGLMPRG